MMRTSRFQSFAPPIRTSGLGLRRLKTAFSPSSTTSSAHTYTLSAGSSNIFSSRSSATSTTSPLSNSLESSPELGHSPTTSSCCSIDEESRKSIVAVYATVTDVQDLPGHFTPIAGPSRLRMLLMRRRKQSMVDIRMREEREAFGAGLGLFEPRPQNQVVVGGIFEVLEGKI